MVPVHCHLQSATCARLLDVDKDAGVAGDADLGFGAPNSNGDMTTETQSGCFCGSCIGPECVCACHFPFREQRQRVEGERVTAQYLLHRIEAIQDEIAALKVRMGL